MENNIEENQFNEVEAWLKHKPNITAEQRIMIRSLVATLYNAGVIAGLDKAKELLPEEYPHTSLFSDKWQFNNGFNQARSLILSRIEEEKGKV